MKGLAKRTVASVAIVAALAFGGPAAAFAGTTTTTTTTTVVSKAPVITTLKQWRAADKLYQAKLKAINLTFLSAVATAKADLAASLGVATNSTERISARATYRFGITEATIARSNALSLLGKPPLKPTHKPAVTTTTL
jgi:hypothetical protein